MKHLAMYNMRRV